MTTQTAGTSTELPTDAGDATAADSSTPPTEGTQTTTPPSTPPAGEPPKDEGTGEPPKGDEPVVPETYEYTMPEGVDLDKAAADEFSTIAKELKLTQEQAQKVADVGAKMAQRRAEEHVRMVEGWIEAVKTDPVVGGDKLEENLAVARGAVDTFGDQELKDLLNTSGIGNHPAVIRAFVKAGKAISQDGFIKGTAKTSENDPAKKMFPNMQ